MFTFAKVKCFNLCKVGFTLRESISFVKEGVLKVIMNFKIEYFYNICTLT